MNKQYLNILKEIFSQRHSALSAIRLSAPFGSRGTISGKFASDIFQ